MHIPKKIDNFAHKNSDMEKKSVLLCILIGLLLCLSCSKSDGDENDDYLRCSNCNKILTTNYDICPKCKGNICPSCIIIHQYGSGRMKQCPKCKFEWNPRRVYN